MPRRYDTRRGRAPKALEGRGRRAPGHGAAIEFKEDAFTALMGAPIPQQGAIIIEARTGRSQRRPPRQPRQLDAARRYFTRSYSTPCRHQRGRGATALGANTHGHAFRLPHMRLQVPAQIAMPRDDGSFIRRQADARKRCRFRCASSSLIFA